MIIYYFYKFNNRLVKYRNKLKWFFLINSLGKKSYIKNGVRIKPNPKGLTVGKGFIISENCFINIGKSSSITIGNNGLMGVGTYINCALGNLSIGDNVAIAPGCKIFTYSHHYDSKDNIISTFKVEDVRIEDNVLIGANVTILPGVTLSKGSIIAAGAVVSQNIGAYEIVGGIPAKLIKKREL